MQNLLEDKNNPNNNIFVIPSEEGGSDDDNYLASIGDAVQKHVYSLHDSERQLWDSLLHMDNTGAIFRIEDSPFHRDDDIFNLQKEENLEKAFEIKILKAFKGQDLNPEHVQLLREEFQKEVERREESEDMADVGIRIPYHEWEKFPQMHRNWDIPSTPKPLFIYMGESKSYFYDDMSENHPDKHLIEQCLNIFNRDWDDITEDFSEWFDTLLNTMPFKVPAVKGILSNMGYTLAIGSEPGTGNSVTPEEVIRETLHRIDEQFQKLYLKAAKKITNKNAIHMLFNINEEKWENDYKEGNSPYKSIKRFGSTLYQDYLKQTNWGHWCRYKQLKRKFAPSIIFKGIDLNRAGIYDMKQALGVNDDQAKKIWFARPFDNISNLRHNSYFKPCHLTNKPQTEKILHLIEVKLKEAIETEDIGILTNLGKVIKGIEVKRLTKVSKDEWQTIWFYYRMLKGELFNTLNEIERRKKKNAKKRKEES